MHISSQHWGRLNQHDVYLFTLDNGRMQVSVSNFGATVVSILFPDKNGVRKNRVLCYENLEGYLQDSLYIGCTVGRFANRISGAAYDYNNERVLLHANEEPSGNQLHGGKEGFNKKVFTLKETHYTNRFCAVSMLYCSKDGEEGFPGNLDVTVTFTLTADDELKIDYHAITDQPTPVSLTNHSYFNLSPNDLPATDHELMICSNEALDLNAHYLPTGIVKPVAHTYLDFTDWSNINDKLVKSNKNGYNNYFIFNKTKQDRPYQSALRHSGSGIVMEVETSYPGMMLYTGNYLTPPFMPQQGVCLETHLYPDSPNHPHFPTAFLLPGDEFQHYTTYRFSHITAY